jgi:hypothetical protein
MRLLALAAVAALASAGAANATIVTVFDGIAAGRASFDSTVTGSGGTVGNTTLSGLTSGTSIDVGDFTISRPGGGSLFPDTYGSMSGDVVDISPSGGGSNPRTDPLDYKNSGLTFTFDSPINSIGFEVGDWATCCFDPVTELFISFDAGAPIKVGSAASGVLFPSQNNPANDVFEIFVAAFDDTGSFSTVSFWGNGIGEYLVAGGNVRYALLDQGSLPPTGSVPLPAAAWMLLAGMGGLAAMSRRKSS